MKTEPLQPARIVFDHPEHPGLAYAPEFADVYHARIGAQAQARHVFLGGNGLPGRWQGRPRFVILETGFGLGNNFLATWAAWRADPGRCTRLIFLSVDKHPPRREDLARAHAAALEASASHGLAAELAPQLLAAWPPATPDLHTLDFEGGQVQLLLAWGDVRTWLPEWVAEVDAFYLDGFAPARNTRMWDPALLRQFNRLAAADATAATWSWARTVREGLSAAGFLVERGEGFGTKRDMLRARRRPPEDIPRGPAPAGRRSASLPGPAERPGRALVIGAGLAGAAAAAALVRQGLQVEVLEAQPTPAAATSGNPAGLFHGVLHAHDGTHAQLLRAAALRAAQWLQPLIQSGVLPGQADGLLRTEAQGGQTLAEMRQLIDRQGLPADYVQALAPDAAAALSGVAQVGPGWWYPSGGWVSPPALVRHWLAHPHIRVRTGVAVAGLRCEPGDKPRWRAEDGAGRLLAEADVVVLAGAHEGLALLEGWTDADTWPLMRRRGQITCLSPRQADTLGLPRPAHPVASGGYLLALPAGGKEGGKKDSTHAWGGLLCGATHHDHDAWDQDSAPRLADHLANLALLDRLRSHSASSEELQARSRLAPELTGRVGWRLACEDRLPLVGPVPLPARALAGQPRLEQPRQVPRVPGLYLLTGLGSRGLTLAPLLGEVLAAWITGAPVPLSSSLMDAIDPARFISRARRRPQG